MIRVRTVLAGVAILVVLAACGTTGSDATDVAVYEGYESWTRVNDEWITGDSTGTLGRRVHEGATGFRNVFVNPVGQRVSAGEDALPYPVGTVLVKEAYSDNEDAAGDLSNVTVMIKRETSYDPENGSWEYVNLSSAMRVRAQGTIASCISCHSAAAHTDYVFTSNR